MTSDLTFLDEQVLNEWIVAQRWFASKTREVSSIEIVDSVCALGPQLVLCLIEARFPVGTHETYQVPLGAAPGRRGLDERVIFEADGWTVYDALADPAAGRELLHAMRANRDAGDSSSSAGRPAQAPDESSTCARSASSSPTRRSSSATS